MYLDVGRHTQGYIWTTCVADAYLCTCTIKIKYTTSLRMNMMSYSLCLPDWSATGFFQKKNISEKVAEVRRERAVRVKNPWPVSARHKRRENTAGVIGCKRAEKKKGIKEERLLGDSPTSLPDLDHHQTLCILQTGPSHSCERTHIVTQGLPLRISQDLLWCCNKWTCMKKKNPSTLSFQLSRCVCTRGPSWLHHWNEIQRIKESVTISC